MHIAFVRLLLHNPILNRSIVSFYMDGIKEWKENVENGKFSFQSDFFWCQPTGFQFRPTHIADQLINNYITFIKVDTAFFLIYFCRSYITNFLFLMMYCRAMRTIGGYWMTDYGARTLHLMKFYIIGVIPEFARCEP